MWKSRCTLFLILLFWIFAVACKTEYDRHHDRYEYNENSWHDRAEDWETQRIRDGWSWDVLEQFEERGINGMRFMEFNNDERVYKRLRDFQLKHFDTLANFSTNVPGYPKVYEDMIRSALYSSAKSLAIKLDLYGDLRLPMEDWLVQGRFIPFNTSTPPEKLKKEEWILGPFTLWIYAEMEMFARINFCRGNNKLPQQSPTKLHVSQLIVINETTISLLTRHFARYEDPLNLPYSPPKFALPEEMDVTVTPWHEIDGTEGDPQRGRLKENVFRYPGPPSESDLFDLLAKNEKQTDRNYGEKITKSGWLANQILRVGILRQEQTVVRSWEFLENKAKPEVFGCLCTRDRWKPSRDPSESEKLMLSLVKKCRNEMYPTWKKLAVAARLSSCLVEHPDTYGKVYEDVPLHTEL